jgi:dihydrolipoamide dehydrogenase
MKQFVDVAVIGSGTSGLNAFATARRNTQNVVLINGGELGTTCARVGCMPSKVLIQIAEDFHRRHVFARLGINGSEDLQIDLGKSFEQVRDIRDIFVDKVLGNSTDNLPSDILIRGYAKLLDVHTIEVNGQQIHAEKIVLATGSQPIIPAAWHAFRAKILTSDELFEQKQLPQKLAVIGLGVIGLELGQALHRLGVEVTGFEQSKQISGLTDPDIHKAALDLLGKEFPIHLGQAADLEWLANGQLKVSAGETSVVVDKILASLGRKPNLAPLGLENLGLPLDARGLPPFNPHTMQVADLPIFIAGDMTGDKAILHEAGHEGKIAGYNATQAVPVAFKRHTPLAITFCDPNIAQVGQNYRDLDLAQTVIGEISFAPVGRALIMNKNKGLLRVYANKADGRVLGASMVCVRGENLAHLIAWAIQQNLTVMDLLRMPFYHPVLEEALQAALQHALRQLDVVLDKPVELQAL